MLIALTKKSERAAAGFSGARVMRAKAGPARLSQQRAYVSLQALHVIRGTPVGEIAAGQFGFQRFGRCVENSWQIHARILDDLAQAGIARRLEQGRLEHSPDISARKLLEINDKRGPLQLILYGNLPRGQGEDRYVDHHAVVLLYGFEDSKGRSIGVLVDGNDLQKNDAIAAALEALIALGSPWRLEMCGPPQVEAMNRQLALRKPRLDVRQAAFRVVDLDQMLRASAAAHSVATGRVLSPSVVAAHMEFSTALLSRQDRVRLRELVDGGALAVESFDAEHAPQ